MTLSKLLSPLHIRGHTFRNRIFSTGDMTVMLQDGVPTDRMVAYHEARAKGGAAILFDKVDTTIPALGHRSEAALVERLTDWPGARHLIGGCLGPRRVEEAVLEGLRIGARV